MRALAALLLLPACGRFFGLDPPTRADGALDDAAVSDSDLDGAPGDAPTDAFNPLNCPTSYSEMHGSSRYRFVTNTVVWTEAAATCAADGGSTAQTHLIVIGDEAERMFLRNLGTGSVWVGLSDRLAEGQYRWNTAENVNGYPPLSSIAWSAGEPSGGLGQDCIATIGSNAQFQDVSCTAVGPFVCECDSYPDDPSRYMP